MRGIDAACGRALAGAAFDVGQGGDATDAFGAALAGVVVREVQADVAVADGVDSVGELLALQHQTQRVVRGLELVDRGLLFRRDLFGGTELVAVGGVVAARTGSGAEQCDE